MMVLWPYLCPEGRRSALRTDFAQSRSHTVNPLVLPLVGGFTGWRRRFRTHRCKVPIGEVVQRVAHLPGV